MYRSFLFLLFSLLFWRTNGSGCTVDELLITGNGTVNGTLTVNGNTYLNTLFLNGTQLVTAINGINGINGFNSTVPGPQGPPGNNGTNGMNAIFIPNGTSLTATSPLKISSNGGPGQISIQVANATESGYLTQSDWLTFNAALNSTTVKPFLQQTNQKYIDFFSGSDSTGDGSQFTPWQSLQHAYNSISPFFNDPVTLFVIGQFDIADTTTITAKPNVNLFGLSGQPIIPFNIVIVGGGANDITYFNNLVIQGSITWIRNDFWGISLYLFNTALTGIVHFEQQGSGRAASFLDAQVSFISGFTVQAGQVTLSACQGFGTFNYIESGASAYCLIQGGNYYQANFTFTGGIQAQFSGVLVDVGTFINTFTNSSGTPAIVSDSASIPATINGPNTLILTAQSHHMRYVPVNATDWTVHFGVVPTTVGQALDLIAKKIT